jgi:nicotinate phosphoribosyltransferase
LSKQAREILDEAGMTGTKIFASGDLNEYKIADLISRGAEIDSFGVGTDLATSFDAPALSGVYKLAGLEENGRVSMRIKLSHDKATYPGPKQIWRLADDSGVYVKDIITLADEQNNRTGSWHPLLKEVMKQGGVDFANRSEQANDTSQSTLREARFARLNDARDRVHDQLRRLPDELLALDSEALYPVGFSERLRKEREMLERRIVGMQEAQE